MSSSRAPVAVAVTFASFVSVVALAGQAGAQEWTPVRDAEGRFSARFPTAPTREVTRRESPQGVVSIVSFTSTPERGVRYGIVYFDPPRDQIAGKDPERVLDAVRDGAVRNVLGKVLKEERITTGAFPGRELVVQTRRTLIDVRIFLVRDRVYQLLVTHPQESGDAATFFAGFTIEAPSAGAPR